MSTQQLRITLAGREHVVEAATTAGQALAQAGLGDQQPGAHAVIAARVNGELRDLASPGGRGRRDRAGRDQRPGRPRHPAPLHRARHGPGRAGPEPRGQAGHRPAGGERLLLRLRRRPAVRAGRPQGHRGADAADRQAGPAVLPPGGQRRRGPHRAGRRALQAGADRAQGRLRAPGRRRVGRGRRLRADHLRQPQPAAPARSSGRTCAAARTCPPPATSRRSS